jgi:hypothetical protein
MRLKSYGEHLTLNIDSRYSPSTIYSMCIAKSAKYRALVGKSDHSGGSIFSHVFLISEDGKSEYIPESKLLYVCQLVSYYHNGLRLNYAKHMNSNINLDDNEDDRNIDVKCRF